MSISWALCALGPVPGLNLKACRKGIPRWGQTDWLKFQWILLIDCFDWFGLGFLRMKNSPKLNDGLQFDSYFVTRSRWMEGPCGSFTKVFPSHAAVLFWVFGVATFGALAKSNARNARFSLPYYMFTICISTVCLWLICLSCGPNSHHERCYVPCKWTRCSNLQGAEIASSQ